ncbi:hypothetical protein J0X57_004163 [Salmonella enterica]|nr:hypothetical protein [Salmonella enterica]EID6351552.1 hypothetical protein [Salmonella enterica]
MKNKITFAPLVMACLLLSACAHNQTGKTSTDTYISLGEFPSSRDVARIIPVERYDEIIITREVNTDKQKDGKAVRTALPEPYRVGIQAIATPVFHPDGTSTMQMKGTFLCIPEQYSLSSSPDVSIHLTRVYKFVLEKTAHPGDRLAVRTEDCTKEMNKLPVKLVTEKR